MVSGDGVKTKLTDERFSLQKNPSNPHQVELDFVQILLEYVFDIVKI